MATLEEGLKPLAVHLTTPPPAAEAAPAHTAVSSPPAAHLPTLTPEELTLAAARPPAIPPAALTPSAVTAVVARFNLQRIPAALDPLGTSAKGLETTLSPFRLAATSRVFGGLQQIKQHTDLILQTLQQPKLPPALIGALHQPDGSAAARVQVQLLPSSVGSQGTAVTVLTADDGGFTLPMPSSTPIPANGVPLTVHGANSNATVTVPAANIAANGMIGVTILPVTLTPLPVSILAGLAALMPTTGGQAATSTPTKAHQPQVTIGEPGSVCVQPLAKAAMTDKFPWGILFRIVEPQMSIVTETETQTAQGGKFNLLPIYATQDRPALPSSSGAAPANYVDRVPIDQPLSVDGFRDQVAGIDPTGNFATDETVPMAASLGLGYILQMSQQWTFQGLGLGNLVYSLPLAPGEQQQMAVFERKDTTAVQESEFFSESEAMTQTALSDTSTNATVSSAFNELAMGGSSFQTSSSSSSWGASGGFSLGFISAGGGGGGGSSSAQGSDSSFLAGQRDATQQATQTTHSSAENQAAARVNASRTGMRMATASESMDVTTKIITNHNHTHALTIQYWEVHRVYDVTTTIDGLTLVCLVPMQMVRFMPPGQPANLSDPSQIASRPQVLERYKYILRHLDVLERAVQRRMRHGLTLLSQFASDPTTVVDASGTVAEDVIGFTLQGGFLPCESIYVAAVTKRNTRVGPVMLAPSVAGQPAAIPQNYFDSQDDLVANGLIPGRQSQTKLQGSLALPSSLNRTDIIGFEITRQFQTLTVTLTSQAARLNIPAALQNLLPTLAAVPAPAVLDPATLERLVGGPPISFFSAVIEDVNAGGSGAPAAPHETYANDSLSGTVLPPQPFPVPALQISPVLRYKDILEIERTARHIVRNTTEYSRAVWMSMTPEERAILLDEYTIGVPPDGLADASQMIPLMNCVQNKVLGTFGNSLVMPFIIPQGVTESMGINPAQLQQALLSYQRESFVPPHSTIALPTKGVLGEAVLGHCPSAEKIDLTRFWNWQDAPADTAPGIGMVQPPTTTPPLTTGVTAPNSLTNLPPLINNLITAPQPNTALLQAMGQQAASQQDFNSSLTGQAQLAALGQNAQTTANSARSDALKTSQTLASQAMQTVSGLISQAMGGSQQSTGKGTQQGGKGTGQQAAGQQGAGQQGAGQQGAAKAGAQAGGQQSTNPSTSGTTGGLYGMLGNIAAGLAGGSGGGAAAAGTDAAVLA